MRTLIHVSAETVTGAINLASFAVALGVIAVTYTGSLQSGLLVTLAAIVSGAAAFIYSARRIFRAGATASPVAAA